MGVRMKAPWDDGKVKLATGQKHFDFPRRLEVRLVRAGLAEALPDESLDHARAKAGMEALVPDEAPSMSMTKAEPLEMAAKRNVPVETDDNKADLVRKIEEAG